MQWCAGRRQAQGKAQGIKHERRALRSYDSAGEYHTHQAKDQSAGMSKRVPKGPSSCSSAFSGNAIRGGEKHINALFLPCLILKTLSECSCQL